MTDDATIPPRLPEARRRASLVGGAAPFVMNLAAIGEAAAATASDYKALVCIFLFGGNDYANTVMPYDSAELRLSMQASRPTLAYAARPASPRPCSYPNTALPGGRQYALAPNLRRSSRSSTPASSRWCSTSAP